MRTLSRLLFTITLVTAIAAQATAATIPITKLILKLELNREILTGNWISATSANSLPGVRDNQGNGGFAIDSDVYRMVWSPVAKTRLSTFGNTEGAVRSSHWWTIAQPFGGSDEPFSVDHLSDCLSLPANNEASLEGDTVAFPAGTVVIIGNAAPAFGRHGGCVQIFVLYQTTLGEITLRPIK